MTFEYITQIKTENEALKNVCLNSKSP